MSMDQCSFFKFVNCEMQVFYSTMRECLYVCLNESMSNEKAEDRWKQYYKDNITHARSQKLSTPTTPS